MLAKQLVLMVESVSLEELADAVVQVDRDVLLHVREPIPGGSSQGSSDTSFLLGLSQLAYSLAQVLCSDQHSTNLPNSDLKTLLIFF